MSLPLARVHDVTDPLAARAVVPAQPLDAERLLRAPPFDALGAPERELLVRETRMRSVGRGRFVCLEGEPAGRAFVLGSGVVRVGVSSVEGRRIAFGILGPSGVFGLLPFFDGGPRSADVRALADSIVWMIPYPSLQIAVERCPGFGRALAGLGAREIRRLRAMAVDLIDLDASRRLAAVLLDLADRFGSDTEHGRVIELPLVQQDLAELVGASRETVSRLIGELASQGIVRRMTRGYVVADAGRLLARHRGEPP
jgi:CRP-like cAMP-binding protein